jgi:hypothetical protein
MKGYLQRMAASAIKPAQSVQPALGTVFAAPRPEAEPVAGVWPESTTVIAAEPEAFPPRPRFEPEATRPVPDAVPDRQESPITETIAQPSRTIGRQAEFPDGRFFEPPLQFEPLFQAAAISPANDPLKHPATASESRGNATRPARMKTGFQTETRTETQVGVENRPLVAPIQQVRERGDATIRDACSRDASSREPRTHRSAPAVPDEVHIHIGQIEVTAVPTPAAPAIRKPVRKSPSLDEYLRRRR